MKITPEKFSRAAGIAAIGAIALALTFTSLSLAGKNAERIQRGVDRTAAQNQRGNYDHGQLRAYPTILEGRLAYEASITAEVAKSVIAASAAVTNVDALTGKVQALSSLASLSSTQIAVLIDDTNTESAATATAAATEVARQVAAAAAAESARQAAIVATQNPDAARALGASIAASSYGWGAGQFSCLNSLWTKESDWRYNAVNSSGGATGIPQSLPSSKMATFGPDYLTNPETQIRWGLDYIQRSYGSPCGAWAHSVARNWY